MRFGNPMIRRMVKKSESGEYVSDGNTATYKGVYLKSALYAVLTILAAVGTELSMLWALSNGKIEQVMVTVGIATAISFVPLLVIALVIVFVPSTVKVLGCIYALLQGALLGCVALFVDLFYPGIALAAFLATAIVFIVALVVNSTLKVRVSSNFVRGLMVALFSLIAVQLVMFVLSLFGLFDYTAYLWIQLGISALCIVWATVMLFWDLQNIDYIVQVGADKKFEWNVAFSLVTTLIYLYVEILELLLRLAMIFSKNRN